MGSALFPLLHLFNIVHSDNVGIWEILFLTGMVMETTR